MDKGLSRALKIAIYFFLGIIVIALIASFMSIYSATKSAKEHSKYEEDIVGTWLPIDEAKGELTFKYGVCTRTYKGKSIQYTYSLNKDLLYLVCEDYGVHGASSVHCGIRIYAEAEETFMELSNLLYFAGKYKKKQ